LDKNNLRKRRDETLHLLNEKTEGVFELETYTENLEAEIQTTIQDKDAVITYLQSQAQAGSGTPTPNTQRSTKQPNPEPFTGMEDWKITFENWQIGIDGKLSVNADHYDNEAAKM